MEEEKKCGKCFACNYYRAYYVKGSMKFEKTKTGFCRKQEKFTGYKDGCNDWQLLSTYRNRYTIKAMQKSLAEMLLKLTEFKQIIEIQQEREQYEKGEKEN